MFRLSQYLYPLQQLSLPDSSASAPSKAHQRPPRKVAPVVIWNLIRRCNLSCKHCYSLSNDSHFKGELSYDEICKVMDDLHAFGVSVLILSGGEPLLHPRIFDIAERAKQMGFYIGLSTNGTLINEDNIHQIAAQHFNYVGISLDGLEATHDRFRRQEGAYQASLNAVRLCHHAGLKVGLRFTLTQENAQDLPAILSLLDTESIDRFYFSHLNYAGRGNKNRAEDAQHQLTRWAMGLLFQYCWDAGLAGRHKEITTGNNDADAVYFLHWLHRHYPTVDTTKLKSILTAWGGNSSGLGIANIDNLGNVHPDTMWWHHTLGNVRQQPFSSIWSDPNNLLLSALRQRPRTLKGRCAGCSYQAICNGNTRVRAEQLYGDIWAEDPGCYLTDEEISV